MESRQSDEHYMQGYQAGDEKAFSELYKRYQGRVYAYLRHKGLSAGALEEVFQEIWMSLHRSRFRYDTKFKFPAWLFTIARSRVIDFWRREKKLSNHKSFEENKFRPSEDFENGKDVRRLPWDQISAADRQSLEWRYLEEASFEEIAQRLDLSPINVRQRISRALKRLRDGVKK